MSKSMSCILPFSPAIVRVLHFRASIRYSEKFRGPGGMWFEILCLAVTRIGTIAFCYWRWLINWAGSAFLRPKLSLPLATKASGFSIPNWGSCNETENPFGK